MHNPEWNIKALKTNANFCCEIFQIKFKALEARTGFQLNAFQI